MWPWELLQEFGIWIWSTTIFNRTEKNTQYCKFRYNGLMSFVSLVLILFIIVNTTDKARIIHDGLKYSLIADIFLLLIRWFFIRKYRRAIHIISFVHLIIHFVLIANWAAVIKYYFFSTQQESKCRSQIESFLFVYI